MNKPDKILDLFFTLSLDLLCIASIDGYFIRLNPSWKDALGFELEDLEGQNFMDLVHPDDVESTLEAVQSLSAGQDVMKFRNRYQRSDGSYRYMEWHSHPEGNLIYAAARDITSFVQAEERLRLDKEMLDRTNRELSRTKEFLEQTNDVSRVGGWEVNLLGNYVIWTDFTRRLHEVDDDFEVSLDSAISFYKEGEDREQIIKDYNRATREGQNWTGEYRIVTAKGNERWVRVSGIVIFNNGKCERLYGAVQDLSERKVMEDELVAARLAADEGNKAKSAFLSNMSHEIRTPLNAIIGMSELIEHTENMQEVRSAIGTINTSGRALLDLISDILDFSKIEAGIMELEQESVSLTEVTDIAAELSKSKAMEKGLSIRIEISSMLPLWIVSDKVRLSQVLTNLIFNAVKFSDQGEVRVRVEKVEKSTIRFSVEDEGIGIPEDSLDKLFLRFSQVDNSTSRNYGGTGLGLAICHRIVELMGGRIWAESKEGVGSQFRFEIPLLATDEPPHMEEWPTPDPSEFDDQILRILTVEDNIVNQKVISMMLKHLGHESTLAASGKEALELISKRRFNMVLLDLHMPEMDGLETAKKLNDLSNGKSPIYIIATTANATSEGEEQCRAAGMNDYLSKPISLSDLKGAIDRCRQALGIT